MWNKLEQFFEQIVIATLKLILLNVRRLRFVANPKYGQKLSPQERISDLIEIFKSTRLYLLFNLVALLIFILLPQGKDVVLIVIEDLSALHFGSLISLLVGLIGWSIISEFGARYKIYITDNSGFSLSAERVNYRKEAQKFVSSFYLLLPTAIIFLSVIIVSFNTIKIWNTAHIWPFASVLVLLTFLVAVLSKFYLDETFIQKLRNKGVWYKIPQEELNWIEKLFGIYNDHVFMMRKSQNFKPPGNIYDETSPTNAYKRFADLLEALPKSEDNATPDTIESFPRVYIIDDELPPPAFGTPIYISDNYEPDLDDPKNFKWKESKDGYYRWIFKNNPSFYKGLHKQVTVISISSLIILLIISTNFLISYQVIGSPALVCLSFACWLGVYTGLLYIDARFKKRLPVSVRWTLVFWLLIVSLINKDHPVRMASPIVNSYRATLAESFHSWFAIRKTETSFPKMPYDTCSRKDSTHHPADSIGYPVFFITAEGGALRTGAFTALLLARLQDSFSLFKKNIFCFSSVSGGTVGISFFNAISYIEPDTLEKNPKYYEQVTKDFFGQDQLSPVIGKMFYGDIINDFWPTPVQNFDRAIALEKAWEHSYAEVFKGAEDENVYSKNFLACYQSQNLPAWFINTTEVESGLQCYISNVRADSFVFAKDRDLLLNKIRGGINYSTAVNFSSRFPLFSPSAALYQNDDRTYHYIDGGYVENTGSKTMLEVLQSLEDSLGQNRVIPYVIHIKFGDSTEFQQTGFLNEISSILYGIYNTRSGSSSTYTYLLEKETKKLQGQFIDVPLRASGNEVPMSWVFSKKSLENLNQVIDSIIAGKPYKTDINNKLMPYLDSVKYKHM